MSAAVPSGVELLVRGDRARARALLEAFFVGRSWRPRERGEGRVDYERGSRRRTLLLGGLAGSRFHVTARLEVRAGERAAGTTGDEGATTIHYRWGADDGRTLGGVLGRARAIRIHAETAAALGEHLAAGGHLVRVRRS